MKMKIVVDNSGNKIWKDANMIAKKIVVEDFGNKIWKDIKITAIKIVSVDESGKHTWKNIKIG